LLLLEFYRCPLRPNADDHLGRGYDEYLERGNHESSFPGCANAAQHGASRSTGTK